MALDLFRVDERLLHGQVLVGWGQRLGIRRWFVIDDALAASAWEQELYESALPEGVSVEFLPVADAVDRIDELSAPGDAAGLLTRDTATMRRLAERGALEGRRVNIGGLHAGPGRRKVLDYVYLGDPEREDLRELARLGARVSARDLPTAIEVGLDALVAP